MDEILTEDILYEYDDSRFPEEFLTDYEALECLAQNEAAETLLIKNRKTGVLFVAKCYSDKSLLPHTTENQILKNLNHSGLPAFIGEYQNEKMLCVVREYAKGVPLNQYAAENEIFFEKAVSIGIQLCNILSYLHGQTPPVIHRDIKPQNIIIDIKGRLKLIDFGISRLYDKAAAEDTIYSGTKHFAAPEQYGFSQTDCRSDIFSLGVLLCWLLTGSTDVKKSISSIGNTNLIRIIKKCTEFDPRKRYILADRVKKDLIHLENHRRRNKVYGFSCTLVCLAFLCIGFIIGRYTKLFPVHSTSLRITFKEPLIEQAVRTVLNKQGKEPVTAADLLDVEELYIYGNKTAGSFEEFEAVGARWMADDGTVHNGGLRSLGDLKKLKNLRRLNIALENISDLTPLGDIPSLELILIKHNPIIGLSPLASLPALRELYLFDTEVSDLSCLAECYTLESLDVGQSYVKSMSAFNGIKNLKCLYMNKAPLETLHGIESFTRLEQIGFSSVGDGDLKPLLKLPQLREVQFDKALQKIAERDLKQAKFEIIYK